MSSRIGWIGLGRMGEAMVGRGHEDVDFAVLLLETARDAGLELAPEEVQVGDGLN